MENITIDRINQLKETEKQIFYKKGRYGKKVPVDNKEKAIDLYFNCEDGAIMEYEERCAKGMKEIQGLRRDGTAAIILSWQYFYPDNSLLNENHF